MKIHTKFGNASIGNHGYYCITDNSTGNKKKLLHRLIFEDYYNISLPPYIIIHHNDGNKLNNKIWNLIPMTLSEHNSLHSKNKTESQLQAIRKAGKVKTLSHNLKNSASRNTTGFYRLGIKKINNKIYFRYSFLKKGKRTEYSCKTLRDIKNKVTSKGLEWIVLDEDKARNTCEAVGENFDNFSM